ncbi:SOS response-associated peptidase [Sunxiuqinia sp. A32]|uniref:SOS response-associated peptidase n=1 Tax=Sunxiuqinia sp. A32 TaxID=3461496 RepID=UPI0040451EA4
MCYDVKARLYTQLNRAKSLNDKKKIKEIVEKLREMGAEDLFHCSGFEHPAILIYTKEHPDDPVLARWGFVPENTKDETKQMAIWNKTLNARGEDMFETWSYKQSAHDKRCLICVDGFYEHYHYKGKTFPYYIHNSNNEPMTLGGIWSEWENKETGEKLKTFSIVTTKGNDLMARIHNNPKLDGPRMPLILPEEAINDWLSVEVKSEADKKRILDLIKPFHEKELSAHTVRRLRGKNAVGNIPEASNQFDYPELPKEDSKNDELNLF